MSHPRVLVVTITYTYRWLTWVTTMPCSCSHSSWDSQTRMPSRSCRIRDTGAPDASPLHPWLQFFSLLGEFQLLLALSHAPFRLHPPLVHSCTRFNPSDGCLVCAAPNSQPSITHYTAALSAQLPGERLQYGGLHPPPPSAIGCMARLVTSCSLDEFDGRGEDCGGIGRGVVHEHRGGDREHPASRPGMWGCGG
jgi:hypothetical protein